MEEVAGVAGGEPIGLSHIGAELVQPVTQRGDGVVETPRHVGARQVIGGDESEDGLHAPLSASAPLKASAVKARAAAKARAAKGKRGCVRTGGMSPPLILIGGPTASGKSGLALAIAEEFRGTVINADSMQVYRDLAILTARPGPAEAARAPHCLYGVLDAADPCSAACWRELAESEIAAAAAQRRLPILVGGTGLYFRALLYGLADIPAIAPAVRAEARRLHQSLGGPGFRAALAARDPAGAARLEAGDTQRLIRAYEVMAATGRPLGAWQQDQVAAPRYPAVAIVLLMPPRPALYGACDARFAAMASSGALDEVRGLLDRRLGADLPVMKAVGVPELARHLSGEISLAEAVRLGQQATRRYAKRQVTWFRHQMPAARVIAAQFSESLVPEIFSFIRQFLLTAGNRPITVAPPR
jgi:tRNA dimethylallyltransferase